MPHALHPQQDSAFAALRQFARKRKAVERCEMCSLELAGEHEHLVEPANRKLICACAACAILFDGQSGAKYKRVPRQVLFLRDFQLTDAQWDGLMVPIEMAFFFNSSPHGKMIALYPSPAGPTESLLSLDTWADIVQMNPILNDMQADVTALLVNRVGHVRGASSAEYYLVPIDECYKLVGLIRTHWRGLSGGTEVWREIGAFFAGLKKRAGVGQEGSRV
ncbi:MAG: hypothetical protein JWN92_523 [Candidatus Acidoferrum typicum]|jgi:hypothetical protein|nr:hypothetical protein [Candidatus Acidoferrum typicum]